MESKQLMIVGVAVVLVVVVAAAAFLVVGNDDEPETPVDPDDGQEMRPVNSRLPVYGNASNNETVDNNDIELIQKIIDGKESRFDWPLADANMDGKVDQADIDVVKKLINGEKTKVYFIDQLEATLCVDYPLDNLVTINDDVGVFMLSINAADTIAGYGGGTKYPVITAGLKETGAAQVESGRVLGAEGWEDIKNIDVELSKKGEKIGAIFVDRYDTLGDYKDDVDKLQIPILGIRVTDPAKTIDGALLVGFLVGPDHFKDAQKYVKMGDESMKYIKDQVSTVKDKTRFISLCMTYYVAQKESQYNLIGIAGGGKSMTDLEGSSSTKLESVEAITKYDDQVDMMLNMKTMDAKVVDPAKYWEDKNIKYLNQSAHFQDMTFINLSMPGICKAVFAAHVMYPELVSEDYALDLLQNCIDSFMDYMNKNAPDGDFDVRTDMTTTLSYQDYLDSKA